MVTEPTDSPVTTPVVLTVATDGLLLDHEPPVIPGVSVVVAPGHVMVAPVNVVVVGSGLTVNESVAAVVPQLLVTR